MKTRGIALTRWSRNPLTTLALPLALWLAGCVVPTAISQDLDPRLIGQWPSSTGSVKSLMVRDGLAYCVMRAGGLAIFDVRNPVSPVQAGSYDTIGATVDVAVSGNLAYVVNWPAGLQVIDISNPANPRLVGGYDRGYDTKGPALAVEVLGGFAYVACGFAGLLVLDIHDRATPQLVGELDVGGYAEDVAVSGRYAYVGKGERFSSQHRLQQTGVDVIDVSNPAAPRVVGSHYVNQPSYNASVGLLSFVSVAVQGDYCYLMCDQGTQAREPGSGLMVIDISDPSDPQFVAHGSVTGRSTGGAGPLPGEVVDLAISGRYAHVVYRGAWNVIEIAEPAAPSRAGSILGDLESVAVSGIHAYAPTRTGGLTVIEFAYEANPPHLSIGPARICGNGSILLPVSGMEGQRVRLQRSENLIDWEDWQTITLCGAGCGLIDTTTTAPARFYRAVEDTAPMAD